MHPVCDIIQAHALLCTLERYLVLDKPGGGVLDRPWQVGRPGPELQESANASQSSQRSSPSKTCNWPIYAQGPDPRRENQLWEVWGGFHGPRLAGQWAPFSIAVCMEKVITTPSREPVPRPRKGNPLGGPVRGIFISSPSHWPVSATVESRESGVVVVQGLWTRWRSLGGPVVECIIVIRGPVAL